MTKRLAET